MAQEDKQNTLLRRLLKKFKQLSYHLYDTQFKKIMWIFVGTIIAGSVIMTVLEFGKMLKGFQGVSWKFFNSIWYTVVTYSTVGYGDLSPQSFSGKVVGLVMIILGVSVTGIITGKIASVLVEQQIREGKGLIDLHKKEDHFIICGWKREISNILADMLRINPDLNVRDIVIVNTNPPEYIDDLRTDSRFAKINFLYGDFSDENVLMRANIKTAKKIFILADNMSNATAQEIDSKTVMTVMMIAKLNKDIYTCAELLDKKFEKYLKMSHCDEIILVRDYIRILLANASSASGVSHVITHLIDVETENPLQTVEIPDEFVNQPVGDLRSHFMEKEGTLLLGILENTGNFFQRKKAALREAQKTPDISKLVRNLQFVKTLQANHPVINPRADYTIPSYARAIVIRGQN